MSETKERRTVVKTVKNAILYSDGTVLLQNVIFSYPNVLEPKPTFNDAGQETGSSYSLTCLMPKDTHDEAKQLLVGIINTMLKENNKGVKLAAKFKFVKNGDPTDEDDMGKPENAGRWVVSTRESKPPIVLDNKRDPNTGKTRRLNPDRPADKDIIYGGCIGNALIRPWWQDNKYGKRVNAGLSVVQFVKDGEPFGSGRIRDDDIDNDEAFNVVDDGDGVPDAAYDDL